MKSAILHTFPEWLLPLDLQAVLLVFSTPGLLKGDL
jgi:hypothetical protein